MSGISLLRLDRKSSEVVELTSQFAKLEIDLQLSLSTRINIDSLLKTNQLTYDI